ncbi:MAG: Mrp/NBP35 family ATP-binding protein [Spirulina sp. SIO3F2]|nr:Mrp/NBP35 family ATP-binding protein [Spirulina sp. SIO3F2]
MTTQPQQAAAKQNIEGIKHIVAIASGKGGVGKSTVAANVAVALAQSGAAVGLLDADIYGPNAAIMLGVEGSTIHVQQGPKGQSLEPIVNHGVKLVSTSFFVRPDQAISWRGPMLTKLIRQFFADVTWGELDYLIVDLPPGTGDAQLTIANSFPITGAVIVTTPQKVALADARRGLKMFERLNVPIFGVVENMSYFIPPDLPDRRYDIYGSAGGEHAAKTLEAPLLGCIPIEIEVRVSGDAGKPIVLAQPASASAQALEQITQQITVAVTDLA